MTPVVAAHPEQALAVTVSADALWVAPHASFWIASSTNAVVLHVFAQAAYLKNELDDVLALTTDSLGPGPLSLTLSGLEAPLDRLLDAGERVLVEPSSLRTPRFQIDLAGARPWKARPPWASLRRRAARLLALRPHLTRTTLEAAPAGSLAELLQGAPASTSVGMLADLALNAAMSAWLMLEETLRRLPKDSQREAEVPHLRSAAARLAGLGSGFTPAGDDFLLGVVYALWSTRPESQAERVARIIAAAAAPRTTTVSGAWLWAGARGEASAAWHTLVEMLSSGGAEAVTSAIARLARIGHTSGADALTGYVLGLGALLEGV